MTDTALVMDGFSPGSPVAAAIVASLRRRLAARGARCDVVVLGELRVDACTGCFGCWVRTPGECVQADDSRALNQKIIRSPLIVLITPVSFGGYAGQAKRALDRIIGLGSPFFTRVAGEVHHQRRYQAYPDFAAIGYLPEADPVAERLFAALVQRNGVNFNSAAVASTVLSGALQEAALDAAVDAMLSSLRAPEVGAASAAAAAREVWTAPASTSTPAPDPARSPRAALLIGSPKAALSTSGALAAYLGARLEAAGWRATAVQVHRDARSTVDAERLAAALLEVDLVALLFPLYIDSMPAPLIQLLERYDAARGRRLAEGQELAPQGLVAIVNNGFPGLAHDDVVLAQARLFAERAGLRWQGGLALSMGEAIGGKPLAELGLMTRNVRRALDLAAAAVAGGREIPVEARRRMGRKLLPHWLYVVLAHRAWKKLAASHGAAARMRDRPYAP